MKTPQRRGLAPSLSDWSVQRLRKLLGWPGLGLIPIALAALITASGAAESNFSISAHTEVVAVEPSCALTLNWSLAAGALTGLAADPLAKPQACGDGRHAVGLTLRAGSRAVLEQLPTGQWQIEVSRSERYASCASDIGGGRPVFEARAGDQPCAADLAGLTYRSAKSKGNDGAQPQAFAHLLEGRVVVGAPVLDPGGWSAPAATVLREARIQARIKDPVTQGSISVLDETIETGSTIDTAPLETVAAPSARGFVRPHKDGGLMVLAHVTGRHVGVTPHAGERRDVSVSRWSQMLVSPFLQALLLAFGVVVWSAGAIGSADTLRENAGEADKDSDDRKALDALQRRFEDKP